MAIGSDRAQRRRGDEVPVVVPLRGVSTAPARRQPAHPGPALSPAPDHDPATGLPTRRRFVASVRGAAERRRSGENPWIAVAALDGLEEVGDREGRQAAEELLRLLAGELRGSLREQDRLARIGDERFGIVLDAPYGDEAMTPLGRLTARVKEAVNGDRRWRGVSLSVGVSPLWHGAPDRAIAEAESALERARGRGSGVAMSTALP